MSGAADVGDVVGWQQILWRGGGAGSVDGVTQTKAMVVGWDQAKR